MDRRTFLVSGGTAILGPGIAAAPAFSAAADRDSAIHHVEVPGYPAPHSPYSHAVVANGLVFVSG
jgi:hypothetical protein